MPFVGIESNGDIRDAGASAGLRRPFAISGAASLKGYPLRIVGMNAVQAVIIQTAGPLVGYEVRIIQNDFASDGDPGWVVFASGTVAALGTPEIVTLPPVIGHHAQIVLISPGPADASGTYQIGAIHT